MQGSEIERAAAAATAVAAELGLDAREAVVLWNSNKLALRLLPCDTFARVAYVGQEVAQFEIDLARRLAALGSPVAAPDPRVAPRVYVRDGFAVTLWTYHEPVGPREVAPGEFAEALARLHAGMRQVDLPAPHYTDRVEEAQRLVGDRALSPELPDDERELLVRTLAGLRRAVGGRGVREQLLHGEPHPGNLIRAREGLLFVDLETCCRGPVEFDIAHAPAGVGAHYPGVDPGLLRECQTLMLAMIVAWRWDPGDQFPDGRRLAAVWLAQMREALGGGEWL